MVLVSVLVGGPGWSLVVSKLVVVRCCTGLVCRLQSSPVNTYSTDIQTYRYTEDSQTYRRTVANLMHGIVCIPSQKGVGCTFNTADADEMHLPAAPTQMPNKNGLTVPSLNHPIHP